LSFVLTVVAVASASAQTPSVISADALSIQVNVPAARLDVMKGQNRLTTYSIAVGLRRYPTPIGDFAVTKITWNPWWYPPKAYWARKEKITAPGPTNPMGKVKMLIGGSVYLHASPFVASIGMSASHACARMLPDDAIALAKLIQATTGAAITASSVDSLLATWDDTREIDLPSSVPVRIEYRLAEVRSDSLLLHPDIYRHRDNVEHAALVALAAAAYDTSLVDRSALRVLARRSRTEHVRRPVRTVLSRKR
jgi:murein L,D-transpeptidase YcbB/YkuD